MYEERVIHGFLCYRRSPDDEWHQYSLDGFSFWQVETDPQGVPLDSALESMGLHEYIETDPGDPAGFGAYVAHEGLIVLNDYIFKEREGVLRTPSCLPLDASLRAACAEGGCFPVFSPATILQLAAMPEFCYFGVRHSPVHYVFHSFPISAKEKERLGLYCPTSRPDLLADEHKRGW